MRKPARLLNGYARAPIVSLGFGLLLVLSQSLAPGVASAERVRQARTTVGGKRSLWSRSALGVAVAAGLTGAVVTHIPVTQLGALEAPDAHMTTCSAHHMPVRGRMGDVLAGYRAAAVPTNFDLLPRMRGWLGADRGNRPVWVDFQAGRERNSLVAAATGKPTELRALFGWRDAQNPRAYSGDNGPHRWAAKTGRRIADGTPVNVQWPCARASWPEAHRLLDDAADRIVAGSDGTIRVTYSVEQVKRIVGSTK
jgi:hypothetical protein